MQGGKKKKLMNVAMFAIEKPLPQLRPGASVMFLVTQSLEDCGFSLRACWCSRGGGGGQLASIGHHASIGRHASSWEDLGGRD